MFETLFGAEMPLALRFFIAFVIVLGLIGGTAYVVRRFGAERLGGGSGRGRPPRLAVIDAAAVDGRRRLILIRRDNVEHLLMIGGPSDVVVEPNIVRAAAAPREAVPQRPAAAPEPLPRAVPLGEGTMWPLQPHVEPAAPPPPPRAQRPAPIQEEPVSWPIEAEPPPPPVRQARPLDPLAGLAAELSRVPIEPEPNAPPPRQIRENVRESPRETARAMPAERQRVEPRPEPRMEQRAEPQAAPTEQAFGAGADQNLADMAQRLEAALRRPAKSREREQRPAEREQRPAVDPMVEMDIAPEPAPPPPPEPKPARMEARAARADAQRPPQKSLYDSLEQEMASLLGRPNGKS